MDIIRNCVCLFIGHRITDSSAMNTQLIINGSDRFLGETARGGVASVLVVQSEFNLTFTSLLCRICSYTVR